MSRRDVTSTQVESVQARSSPRQGESEEAPTVGDRLPALMRQARKQTHMKIDRTPMTLPPFGAATPLDNDTSKWTDDDYQTEDQIMRLWKDHGVAMSDMIHSRDEIQEAWKEARS